MTALLKKFLFRSPDAGNDGAGKKDDKPLLDDKGAFSGKAVDDGKTNSEAKKPDTPSKVKVKVGDVELETDEGSAAAINALLQSNAQMADFIRKGYKAPEEKPAAKKDAYDYATGLFTEPDVALQRLRAEIKQEVLGEVTAAYSAAESKKDFWTTFYTENSDLKPEKLIVDAVMARDWAKLKDLSPADAGKKIAEAAKKEIMRLSGGKSTADPNARPVEGSGNNKNSAPGNKTDDPEKVLSLSDVIRRRKEARAKAASLQIRKE